jgi:hypothetical protein
VFDSNGNWIIGSYWNKSKQWIHKGNVTLYAQWRANTPGGYTLTFNPNGGALQGGNFGSRNGTGQTASVKVTYGKTSYNSGMRATRSGYMFIGWWTAKSGGSQIYDASGRYKPNSRCWTANGTWKHQGNAALYARWLPITLGGNKNWTLLADGSWKSGAITNSQDSWIQTTVKGAGTLTFHWKVSCESGGGRYEWDYLEWLVDGVRQKKIDGTLGAWSAVSLKIDGAGTHTIQWRYRKDGSKSEGKDCGWIRNVYWSGSVQ